jgi:fumarylacetoacetate (FAA) hydrolase
MPSPFLGPRDPLVLPPGDVGLDIEGEIAMIELRRELDRTDIDPVKASALLDRVASADAAIRRAELVARIAARSVLTVKQRAMLGRTSPLAASAPAGGRGTLRWCRCQSTTLDGNAVDMSFDFRDLVSHATSTRPLGVGTVIATGTVSNRDRTVGSACIAERRMIETLEFGAPRTAYLGVGDTFRIEMLDATGASVFGAIAQRVVGNG